METLGQILDQDPRSLSPNSDRNEHLRGTEIFKAQLEQSVIPSDGVGSRAGSLCPSGFNAVGSRAAEVSQKGGEDSEMLIAEMRVEHSLNERDIPVPSSTDTASSKDAVDHQAGNRGQELNSVAVFTHQVECSQT